MVFSRSFLGWAQSCMIIGLGWYVFCGAFDIQKLWLVDGANLLFHEAGHILFGLFGEWIGFWGGTLMQLLMPLSVGIAFWFKKQKYSFSVMMLWLGENFFGISRYIKDARTQTLPLVGGETHDWGYLLGRMRLLNHDQIIGDMVWIVGIFIVLGSVVAGLMFSEAKQHVSC